MTEPEELDEDLFADLYEADEPAPSTAPAVPPSSAPEPVEIAPSTDTAAPPHYDAPQESNEDESYNITDFNQNNYTNGQDEKDTSRWDHDGRGSRMDVVAEQDSGSIGIKEDG
ncbi:MAG: hypothetical protein Q9170_007108 [Blastenia crenularia]